MPDNKEAGYYGGHLHLDLVARYFTLLGTARTILDVGCGLGSIGRWKPGPDYRVTGIDHDGTALREAARWETIVAADLDEERLPFAAGSFQAVVAKDVLEHFVRPWRIVAEIHRVLAPGGLVLVNTPMPKPSAVWNDYTHVRGFTRSALRQMFIDARFEVLQIIRMGGMRGAGKLRLVHWLPTIMNLPVLGNMLAINYELLARKRS
jgi:SAM-dependent methyltransferase